MTERILSKSQKTQKNMIICSCLDKKDLFPRHFLPLHNDFQIFSYIFLSPAPLRVKGHMSKYMCTPALRRDIEITYLQYYPCQYRGLGLGVRGGQEVLIHIKMAMKNPNLQQFIRNLHIFLFLTFFRSFSKFESNLFRGIYLAKYCGGGGGCWGKK